MSRLSPVKYLNRTVVFVMSSSIFQVLRSTKSEQAQSDHANKQAVVVSDSTKRIIWRMWAQSVELPSKQSRLEQGPED
jgi:hypothetical protein